MSVDHAPFLEEEHESLLELPGFPYLRIEPILLLGNIDDIDELWESEQEELLFSLHGPKGQFLVVSNHRFCVYQIPKSKGFIRGTAEFFIGMTPLGPISDLMDGVDAVKDVAEKANSFRNWVSPKQRRQRAANKEQGMPNPKDIKDITWKTKDLETVFLISCYRERILLENAFKWKLKRQSYWRNDEKKFPAIHFGEAAITFVIMDREGEISTEEFEIADACGIHEIAEYVAEMNLALLQKHGWTAGLDEGVVVQDEAFQAE